MDNEIDKEQSGDGVQMGFLAHLEELRWRILKSIMTVIVAAMVAFYFSEYLVRFIKIPLGDVQLYNIAVTGSFYAYLKISFFAGVLGALPIVFYQAWSFLSPGLYAQEKKAVLPMVAISTFLFLLGAAFCFVVVLPISFKFLIGFSGDLIVNTITIGSYISFIGLLLLAFGCGFQMPIVAHFLGKMGVVTSSGLSKGRRYAFVTILVVGAIVTPPDVFTQFLLAVPLYILYEISILVVWIGAKREKQAADEEDDDYEIEEAPPEID